MPGSPHPEPAAAEVAPPTPSSPEGKLTSVLELRGSVFSEEHHVNPPVVAIFEKSLEVFLLQQTCVPRRMLAKGKTIAPDAGLDAILLKSSEDQRPFITQAPKQFMLNFIGRVSRIPYSEAIHICTVWGMDFLLLHRIFDPGITTCTSQRGRLYPVRPHCSKLCQVHRMPLASQKSCSSSDGPRRLSHSPIVLGRRP